jgi:hypothetical protein
MKIRYMDYEAIEIGSNLEISTEMVVSVSVNYGSLLLAPKTLLGHDPGQLVYAVFHTILNPCSVYCKTSFTSKATNSISHSSMAI